MARAFVAGANGNGQGLYAQAHQRRRRGNLIGQQDDCFGHLAPCSTLQHVYVG